MLSKTRSGQQRGCISGGDQLRGEQLAHQAGDEGVSCNLIAVNVEAWLPKIKRKERSVRARSYQSEGGKM